MADPAIAEAAALEAARERVSILSDTLSNNRTIAIFDEKKRAAEFTRWLREITQAATNAGQDFKMALLTLAIVAPAPEYTEEMALRNVIHGIPTRGPFLRLGRWGCLL
jgi:hypothetical protein